MNTKHTISACLIVKNEGDILDRCLSSIHDLVDEIVIVDTGSTDNTKDVASKYTDKIYDFSWIDDFSAARNYAFSLCTCDYIYSADADEYLDEENRRQFTNLMECLLPEIEIVQMHYHTISNNTVLNVQDEYRPKLYKRLRDWTWIDPIHETVRLLPVVFDSDVTITHAPKTMHHKRDFSIFLKSIERDNHLSDTLLYMYAAELLKNGATEDFEGALNYFSKVYYEDFKSERADYAAIVLCRYFRLLHDATGVMKFALEGVSKNMTSELCFDVASYYLKEKDFVTALKWAKMAYEQALPLVDVHTGGDEALKIIVSCLKELEIYDDSLTYYEEQLKNWVEPTDF